MLHAEAPKTGQSVHAKADTGMTATLLVRVGGRSQAFAPAQRAVIGRDPGCDVVVDHDLVSRRHAYAEWSAAGWVLRDLGSSNGTWMHGQRITEVPISGPVAVTLGGVNGSKLELSLQVSPRDGSSNPHDADDPSRLGQLTAVHPFAGTETLIGRAPDCDVFVDDLTVSRNHAVIRRSGTSFTITDLGSTNGTFVNGKRVQTAELVERDVVSIGGHVFRFTAGSLSEYSEAQGAWLCATGIYVRVAPDIGIIQRLSGLLGGRDAPAMATLLVDIGFAVAPSSLVSIVGPSGAGKTTLLKALTGQQPATQGQVLYGGRDLYDALDLRLRMGYVPQDDLLHPQLTVREALDYAAELRFAADVDATSRAARVAKVMEDLSLDERAQLAVGRLSGGQRKRTSIAAELLTEPSLLFLDEPTSGLDPGHEENVTQLLRALANAGRTVVTTTHSLVTLQQSDNVLYIARGGHLAYYGPPGVAIDYFRKNGHGEEYPKIFGALEDNGSTFADEFRRSSLYIQNVQEPLARAAQTARSAEEGADTQTRPDNWRQFSVLVRRYLAVLRADRTSTFLIAAQAPFFSALFALLYSSNVMLASSAQEATILVWLMVIGAAWMGTSNAIREVVKEFPIVRRERGLGLSLGAYIGSKLAVLSIVTTIQCSLLAIVTMLPQQLPVFDDSPGATSVIPAGGVFLGWQMGELVLDIVLVGLASMGVGLLISVLVKNQDQANFVLPMVLVAQVVLSAPTFDAPGGVFTVIGLPSSAQWGSAAAGSTLSLNIIRKPLLTAVEQQRADAKGTARRQSVIDGRPNWDHTFGVWLLDVGALIVIAFAAIGAALWLLSRRIDRPSRSG